jgi:hypothetical protein
VDGIGTGILMIKMRVFDKISEVFFDAISFRDHGWFSGIQIHREDTIKELGTDYSFSYRAKQAGFKIYCDTSIPIGHLGRYNYTINDYLTWQKEAIKHNEESAPNTIPFIRGRLAEGEQATEGLSIREWVDNNCQEA